MEEPGCCREGTREADRLLEEHRGAEGEAKRLQAGLDMVIGRLSKARDKYEKKAVEAELAEERLARAEPDIGEREEVAQCIVCVEGVSRAELERTKEEAEERRGRAERAREEYGSQVRQSSALK